MVMAPSIDGVVVGGGVVKKVVSSTVVGASGITLVSPYFVVHGRGVMKVDLYEVMLSSTKYVLYEMQPKGSSQSASLVMVRTLGLVASRKGLVNVEVDTVV
jgi:hypothetical protein